MKIIKSYYTIMSPITGDILLNIERAGRTCYKSEDRITNDSAADFVRMLISRGHESVLEHEKISVLFVCDRGVSHELVRHRIASFSQESTRYCNYTKDRFGGEVTFILPPWCSDKLLGIKGDDEVNDLITDSDVTGCDSVFLATLHVLEASYIELIKGGWTPQQARSVLPNALKTEIVVTANLREWRTILRQRTSAAAHPQMQELMRPLLDEFQKLLPVVFDDITY